MVHFEYVCLYWQMYIVFKRTQYSRKGNWTNEQANLLHNTKVGWKVYESIWPRHKCKLVCQTCKCTRISYVEIDGRVQTGVSTTYCGLFPHSFASCPLTTSWGHCQASIKIGHSLSSSSFSLFFPTWWTENPNRDLRGHRGHLSP